jgi:hypothetical protein
VCTYSRIFIFKEAHNLTFCKEPKQSIVALKQLDGGTMHANKMFTIFIFLIKLKKVKSDQNTENG